MKQWFLWSGIKGRDGRKIFETTIFFSQKFSIFKKIPLRSQRMMKWVCCFVVSSFFLQPFAEDAPLAPYRGGKIENMFFWKSSCEFSKYSLKISRNVFRMRNIATQWNVYDLRSYIFHSVMRLNNQIWNNKKKSLYIIISVQITSLFV